MKPPVYKTMKKNGIRNESVRFFFEINCGAVSGISNTDKFELGLCFKNAASPASLKRTGMNAARLNPVKWTDLGAVKQHLRIK